MFTMWIKKQLLVLKATFFVPNYQQNYSKCKSMWSDSHTASLKWPFEVLHSDVGFIFSPKGCHLTFILTLIDSCFPLTFSHSWKISNSLLFSYLTDKCEWCWPFRPDLSKIRRVNIPQTKQMTYTLSCAMLKVNICQSKFHYRVSLRGLTRCCSPQTQSIILNCMNNNNNLHYCLPHKCIIVVQYLVFHNLNRKALLP